MRASEAATFLKAESLCYLALVFFVSIHLFNFYQTPNVFTVDFFYFDYTKRFELKRCERERVSLKNYRAYLYVLNVIYAVMTCEKVTINNYK